MFFKKSKKKVGVSKEVKKCSIHLLNSLSFGDAHHREAILTFNNYLTKNKISENNLGHLLSFIS